MSETSDGTRSPFGERSLRPCSTGPKTDHQQSQEHAERRRRLNVARRGAPLRLARVLRDVGRRSAVLTAKRQALQQPQAHQEDRGQPSDAGDRADTGNGMRTESGEQPTNVVVSMTIMVTRNTLRPRQITDAPEDDGAEGTHEKSRKNGTKIGKGRRRTT